MYNVNQSAILMITLNFLFDALISQELLFQRWLLNTSEAENRGQKH